MIRKKFFTLVEILIVLAILTLVAGIAGTNMLKMRRDQQFRSGVSLVEQKLQAALETMLIHHDNVRVIFDHNGKKIKLNFETETPLEKGMGRLLETDKDIEGIRLVVFETPEKERSAGKITLVFSAMANATPKGTLFLYGYDSSQKKTIVLRGYPHPIKTSDDDEFEEKDDVGSEEFYPKEIRDIWRMDKLNS